MNPWSIMGFVMEPVGNFFVATAQSEISECDFHGDRLRIHPPVRLLQDLVDKVSASSGEIHIDLPDGHRLFRDDGSNLAQEYRVPDGKKVLVLRKP